MEDFSQHRHDMSTLSKHNHDMGVNSDALEDCDQHAPTLQPNEATIDSLLHLQRETSREGRRSEFVDVGLLDGYEPTVWTTCVSSLTRTTDDEREIISELEEEARKIFEDQQSE